LSTQTSANSAIRCLSSQPAAWPAPAPAMAVGVGPPHPVRHLSQLLARMPDAKAACAADVSARRQILVLYGLACNTIANVFVGLRCRTTITGRVGLPLRAHLRRRRLASSSGRRGLTRRRRTLRQDSRSSFREHLTQCRAASAPSYPRYDVPIPPVTDDAGVVDPHRGSCTAGPGISLEWLGENQDSDRLDTSAAGVCCFLRKSARRRPMPSSSSRISGRCWGNTPIANLHPHTGWIGPPKRLDSSRRVMLKSAISSTLASSCLRVCP